MMRDMFDRLENWLFDNPVFTDILSIMLPVIFFVVLGICCNSCGPIKEIPVHTIEKIEYRDSLIYVHDSIEVPVPYEKIVEVIPDIDTSYLETSVAKSTAYLDNGSRKLHHTLEQKGTIEYMYDTVHVVQYVDRIIEKEVPIEVTKEVKEIPKWVWLNLIYSVVLTMLGSFRIYLKVRQSNAPLL